MIINRCTAKLFYSYDTLEGKAVEFEINKTQSNVIDPTLSLYSV